MKFPYDIRHSTLLFLALLLGATGCAFNSLESFTRGEGAKETRVYDGTYEDVYRSAVAAAENIGFRIKKQDPSTGEILSEGYFAKTVACDANLLALYVERSGTARTKIEVHEAYSGRTAGCQDQYPRVMSEITMELMVLKAGPMMKPSDSLAAIAEPAVVASDVDSPPSVKAVQRKHAYAIVIGIEKYREKLPKADFAAHDAKIVGQYLTKVAGYSEENVVVLLNDRATRTDIEKYVESWLPNHMEKGDSIFIYFSGHGAPSVKTGDAYLVPYDGDPAFIDKTGYSLKRLYEQLAKLPSTQAAVVLDSCFSGAGGRSVIAQGMRPMGLSVEAPLLAGGKTAVLAASAGDQVSSTYQQKSHGLLTYFFLKGLGGEADMNKDGTIDIAELYEYVKPQVSRVARREFNNDQIPQLLGSSQASGLGMRVVETKRP